MSSPAEAGEVSGPRIDPVVLAAVAGLGLLTLVLVIAGDGNLGMALAPLIVAILALAAFRMPLRHSLLALGFLCLILESPSEVPANGLWQSPLYPVGELVLQHLNKVIPVKALFFSGLDVALVLLAIVWVFRRMTGSPLDMRGRIPPAAPLRTTALLSIAAIFLVWGYGLLRAGADVRFSLWQVNRVIYLPCIFLLCCAAARGPSDARAFGTALVAAALVRALLAAYLRHLFPSTEEMPHATTHADSMLFADAFLLVLIALFEQRNRRNLIVALSTLPVLTVGMIANNRRLVWIELLSAFTFLCFIIPSSRFKKTLTRIVAFSLPVLALYVAIGWNRSSFPFQPIHSIQSAMDSSKDKSALWRDLENYDLYYTVKQNPVLGTGFGHGYEEVVRLPDISRSFELYRFAPHNSVLGLLAFAGYVGFSAIWLIFPLGVFFAVRSYRFSTVPRDRITALTALATLIVFVVHCYGDLGFGTATFLFTVAPALALIAKQATATGAWPLSRRRLMAS